MREEDTVRQNDMGCADKVRAIDEGVIIMATPALSSEEITAALEKLPGWRLEGDAIVKTYSFDSYVGGLVFATAAGTIAEGQDHHPDITIGWRKVTVRFTTHSAGNKLSHKDFDVAAAIDALPYPRT